MCNQLQGKELSQAITKTDSENADVNYENS